MTKMYKHCTKPLGKESSVSGAWVAMAWDQGIDVLSQLAVGVSSGSYTLKNLAWLMWRGCNSSDFCTSLWQRKPTRISWKKAGNKEQSVKLSLHSRRRQKSEFVASYRQVWGRSSLARWFMRIRVSSVLVSPLRGNDCLHCRQHRRPTPALHGLPV